MSNNEVRLIGNVGADPKVGSTKDGASYAFFNIAVTERFKKKNGELAESSEWFDINTFGYCADYVKNNVSKGDKVLVMGKIKTQKSTKVDKFAKEFKIQALQVFAIRNKKATAPSANYPGYNPKNNYATNNKSVHWNSDNQDIPF